MKTLRFSYKICFAFLMVGLFSCSNPSSKSTDLSITDKIVNKYKAGIISYTDKQNNPRNIEENGELRSVSPGDWCSGFYPGALWYAYELTGEKNIKIEAEKRTVILEDQKLNGITHDMGFKVYCSYGNGYRLTENESYKEVLLQSAKTLTTRYKPEVGCIRSWDHHDHLWQYPVIIDNMMNLELLFWAFKETGDSTYYNISVSHADVTMKNHFREDYSTYHVIGYDSITGEVLQRNTHQGYADETAWARGQGWGLYGYTLMYRETQDPKYLEQAEHIAAFILNHPNMPEDLVPYWDFNAPKIPNEPRDASAAAVICSALYELSTYAGAKANYYKTNADKILTSLNSDAYFAAEDAPHHFLLEHATGNWPNNSEIDCPIIYADYYYLEALLRKKNLE